jgi:hypothetical protein
MPYDKHNEMYRALQARYRCHECNPSGVRWCWKQDFKGWTKPHHVQLNATLLSTWATAIINHSATDHYPPRIPEFDDLILEPLYKRNPNHTNHANSANLLISQMGGRITQEFHILHGGGNPWEYGRKWGPGHGDTSLSSPAKWKRKVLCDALSSPISTDTSLCVEDGVSLHGFQNWCQTHHQSEYNWTDVFDILHDADVGLDSFSTKKKTKASKLIQLCALANTQLKEAAAEHLCKAHARWVRKGKPIF